MTFREYVVKLIRLVSDHPECMDFTAVFSKDDEGNEFSMTVYDPAIGQYNQEERSFEENKDEANAVCIN